MLITTGDTGAHSQHIKYLYNFRFNLLYRYGGAYQDFDCMWINKVPQEMLEMPVVVSPAISLNGQFPEGIALGMIMAKKG